MFFNPPHKLWGGMKNASIASIWNRSIRHMWATFPGVEFLRALSMFKQKKENLSLYVHVLHKMSHWEVSRRSGPVDVTEMY